MNFEELFTKLEFARNAIEKSDAYSFDDFVELLEKPNPDDMDIWEMAWKQAWHEHCEKRKESVALRVKVINEVYYKWYVEREKSLTPEEFDEILKENGFMRIPKE